MTNRALGKQAVELDSLAAEHSQIQCRYAELDDAILQALGSRRIIEAARELVRAMLLHFIHEEQFREKIARSSLHEPRNSERKIMAAVIKDVMKLEAGLIREDVHAALRLRGLCKGWMRDHMHVEGVDFEIALVANAPGLSRAIRPNNSRVAQS